MLLHVAALGDGKHWHYCRLQTFTDSVAVLGSYIFSVGVLYQLSEIEWNVAGR